MALTSAIDKCEAVVAILSAASSTDPYSQMELDLAEAREVRDMRPRLFLVRIDDSDPPQSLGDREYIDLSREEVIPQGLGRLMKQLFPPPAETIEFELTTTHKRATALELARVAAGELASGGEDANGYDALIQVCRRLGYTVVLRLSETGGQGWLAGVEETASGARYILAGGRAGGAMVEGVRELGLPVEVPSGSVAVSGVCAHIGSSGRPFFRRTDWVLDLDDYTELIDWLRTIESSERVVPYLLASARRELDASRTELAALLGVPTGTLVAWERRQQTAPPDLEEKIAGLLRKKSLVRHLAGESDRRRRGGVRVYPNDTTPLETLGRQFLEKPAWGWVWLFSLLLGVFGDLPGLWPQLALLLGFLGLGFTVDRMVPRCSECGARVPRWGKQCPSCLVQLRR